MGLSPGGSYFWNKPRRPGRPHPGGREELAVGLALFHPKPCRAAPRWAGEDTGPYVGGVTTAGPTARLLRCFFFDDDLQVRGHVLVQLDGDGELAHGLEWLVDLNFSTVHVKALLGQRIRDVAGGD